MLKFLMFLKVQGFSLIYLFKNQLLLQLFDSYIASFCTDFEPPSPPGKIWDIKIVVGAAVVAVVLVLLTLGILWRKGWLGGKTSEDKGRNI